METYYAFSDEAGAYEPHPNKKFIQRHPFYVRATVLFRIDDYSNYQTQIRELNKKKGIPNGEEIKWSDIWSIKRGTTRNNFIAGVGYQNALEYVNEVFSLAENTKDLKMILTATQNNTSHYAKKNTMIQFHLQEAFQRINSELINNGFATFILDELSDTFSDQVKSVCHGIIENGDIVNYSSLYSGILFEKSNLSAGIQLADYTAGVFNSFLKSIRAAEGNYQFAKEKFFGFIKPRLRKSPSGEIMGYGIREVTRDEILRIIIDSAIQGDVP